MCGEAELGFEQSFAVTGPSPRVRGSPAGRASKAASSGSIPACAGKPCSGSAASGVFWVHPRVCGEAASKMAASFAAGGPSPRVRGSLGAVRGAVESTGSIPACAGKPHSWFLVESRIPVHPRVCGEAALLLISVVRTAGPSPRVRGSLLGTSTLGGADGSIPACAGKPVRLMGSWRWSRVHPRVCGEAPSAAAQSWVEPGPSPRVRGSPQKCPFLLHFSGSIPACAGKPGAGRVGPRRERVHPRVCGEAAAVMTARAAASGPSPRVRGSRHRGRQGAGWRGSIPACAGKPFAASRQTEARRVHPRVCGEALLSAPLPPRRPGPSPRVRGSRPHPSGSGDPPGSIPACAGKPGMGVAGCTIPRPSVFPAFAAAVLGLPVAPPWYARDVLRDGRGPVLEAQTSVSRFRSDQPYQRPSSRWHLAGTQRLGEIPNSWRAGDLVAKSGVAAGSAARRPE